MKFSVLRTGIVTDESEQAIMSMMGGLAWSVKLEWHQQDHERHLLGAFLNHARALRAAPILAPTLRLVSIARVRLPSVAQWPLSWRRRMATRLR